MMGAYAYLIELWSLPAGDADTNRDGRVSDEEMLQWVDVELGGEGWIAPHLVKHPDLGPVWIGGSAKLSPDPPPLQGRAPGSATSSLRHSSPIEIAGSWSGRDGRPVVGRCRPQERLPIDFRPGLRLPAVRDSDLRFLCKFPRRFGRAARRSHNAAD
jgi:hypothetical protein